MTKTQTIGPVQQQFEQLFQRSRHRAYRLAYRMTGNATEAEDITQDAYVSAWKHFASYNSSYSFETWLFRIVTNRVIDLHRRRKLQKNYSLDAMAQIADGKLFGQFLTAPHSDPEQIVLEPILEESLRRALLSLPASYRRALLLCAVEQRTYQEIAVAMHCPLGTVRSRIHRGRVLVRRTLERTTIPGEHEALTRSDLCR